MVDSDAALSAAKRHMTDEIMRTPPDPERLGQASDNLNETWYALTAALIRQREERDRIILSLIDQLAERKHG